MAYWVFYYVFHIMQRFNFCLFHSVLLFPPVTASFLCHRSQMERVRRRKSPQVLLSFPLLCSRRFFMVNLRENQRSVSPVRTPPHSPSILSHPFIHTFLVWVSCARKHKYMQICTHRRHRLIFERLSFPFRNTGIKKVWCVFFQINGDEKCSKTV